MQFTLASFFFKTAIEKLKACHKTDQINVLSFDVL